MTLILGDAHPFFAQGTADVTWPADLMGFVPYFPGESKLIPKTNIVASSGHQRPGHDDRRKGIGAASEIPTWRLPARVAPLRRWTRVQLLSGREGRHAIASRNPGRGGGLGTGAHPQQLAFVLARLPSGTAYVCNGRAASPQGVLLGRLLQTP